MRMLINLVLKLYSRKSKNDWNLNENFADNAYDN